MCDVKKQFGSLIILTGSGSRGAPFLENVTQLYCWVRWWRDIAISFLEALGYNILVGFWTLMTFTRHSLFNAAWLLCNLAVAYKRQWSAYTWTGILYQTTVPTNNMLMANKSASTQMPEAHTNSIYSEWKHLYGYWQTRTWRPMGIHRVKLKWNKQKENNS